MAVVETMELLETRLATFQAPPATGRKRASTAKGAKSGKWSLKRPSVEELAQAGFYFAPTGSGSDNVTCFCCEKSLDGWEEGDNAFNEHMHFSGDCAWAILMAIENDADEELKNEDPMSDRLLDARRQTFRDQWPHEKKRGWTCKVQKMIEGGWYFSPSPEGEDQTSCVYCKKTLFGWEPKDKPYDEHKKRSPDCFFFSSTGAKPASKGRKGRASKTSRVSSQSIANTDLNESVAVAGHDEATQASMMTVDMSMASTATKAKKGTRAKKATAKSTRAKEAVAAAETIEEVDQIVMNLPLPPANSTRGKKRTSDQVLEESAEDNEPPRKRTTRIQGSTARVASRGLSIVAHDVDMEEAESQPVISKKGVKGGRKRASSTARKTSTRVVSVQSAPTQPIIPADDSIDAALAADLERFESDDDDSDNWKVLGTDDSVMSQMRQNALARSSNVRSSAICTKGKANSSLLDPQMKDASVREPAQISEDLPSVPVVAVAKKTKAKAPAKRSKTQATEVTVAAPQTIEIMDLKEFEESLEADDQEHVAFAAEAKEVSAIKTNDTTNLSQATIADDSGHETDGSILAQNKAKRNSKKVKPAAKTKKPVEMNVAKSKTNKKTSAEVVFGAHAEVEDADVAEELEAMHAEVTAAPLKTQQAASVDVRLDVDVAPAPKGPGQRKQQIISPEPSPQASDAENQPPSARPSQTRPPLARYSPSGARSVRIPLAPSTPTASPSKRNNRLETTYPWAPADIDYILTGTPAVNKENVDLKNVLNTEEKKMTLEEWIHWNAKKNEDRLKAECERMVGKFENEGVRALKTLEGIVCSD